MMNWIFTFMILFGIVWGALNGRMEAVSSAAMGEAGNAVQLVITLLGSLCLWSGIMKVADEAKLTQKLARLFSPVLRLLFKGLDMKSPAAKAISMNVAANLLGLGNAATPLGLKAMAELEKEARKPKSATNHMVLFVVLNTAALQLIPTTTAMLRMNAGSQSPMDVVPAVWIASAVSVVTGIVVAKALERFWKE